MRGHNAPDVARRNFLRDVGRLGRFCDREDQNGLALLITNEAALWRPRQRRTPTRDEEFGIHHGRELSGTLPWARRFLPGQHPSAAGHLHAHLASIHPTGGPGWRVRLPRGVHHSEPSAAPAPTRGVTSRLPRILCPPTQAVTQHALGHASDGMTFRATTARRNGSSWGGSGEYRQCWGARGENRLRHAARS